MSVTTFEELKSHRGHDVECVTYGNINAAIECNTCATVLFDIDREGDSEAKLTAVKSRRRYDAIKANEQRGA